MVTTPDDDTPQKWFKIGETLTSTESGDIVILESTVNPFGLRIVVSGNRFLLPDETVRELQRRLPNTFAGISLEGNLKKASRIRCYKFFEEGDTHPTIIINRKWEEPIPGIELLDWVGKHPGGSVVWEIQEKAED